MTTDVRRYVRYRNCAKALRAVADDYSDPAIRDELLKLAEDFDRLAGVLEHLIRLKPFSSAPNQDQHRPPV